MSRPMKICSVVGITLLAAAIGCGGNKSGDAKSAANEKGPKDATGKVVKPEAEKMFNVALDDMNAHDKASDWNEAICVQVAKEFDDATKEQNNKFSESTYNAGLALQRCGKDKEAREHFERARRDNPSNHYAGAQLALYQYKDDKNADAVINALESVVQDAKFNNVPALVNLAMFQMQRDGASGGSTCKTFVAGAEKILGDFECAKMNLQRALAIDDSYMPAFNQLALYYFNGAKKRVGKGGKAGGRSIATNAALGKRADAQQLELAALVCAQAIRKDQDTHNKTLTYAPIHNTAGLVLNELGQVNGAVGEFKTAVKLDARFFEAHMNLAAVNLSFRGFKTSEEEYRQALGMHGDDYDAHLGLALALRGQIDDTNYDKQVAGAQSELDSCKKIDANRPDAYYNEGILTQEYKAKAGGDKTKVIATYNDAIKIFETFIGKASDKPEYKAAVDKSQERIKDMKQTIDFLNEPAAPEPGAATPPAAGAAPSGDKKDDKKTP